MKLQVSQRCCRCCCNYNYVTRWRLITATLQRRVDAAVKPLYPAAPDFAHWPTWWRRLQPTTTPGILLRSLVYLSWAEYCDERVCRTSPKFFCAACGFGLLSSCGIVVRYVLPVCGWPHVFYNMTGRDRSTGKQQRHCKVVCRLTPLPCVICRILS